MFWVTGHGKTARAKTIDRQHNIFVYQTPDHQYGAGYIRRVCEKRGRILEVLPINNEKEINFVVSRGSNHGDVTHRVVQLAEAARQHIGKNIEADVREDAWMDLCSQSLWKRIKTALRIIRG